MAANESVGTSILTVTRTQHALATPRQQLWCRGRCYAAALSSPLPVTHCTRPISGCLNVNHVRLPSSPTSQSGLAQVRVILAVRLGTNRGMKMTLVGSWVSCIVNFCYLYLTILNSAE